MESELEDGIGKQVPLGKPPWTRSHGPEPDHGMWAWVKAGFVDKMQQEPSEASVSAPSLERLTSRNHTLRADGSVCPQGTRNSMNMSIRFQTKCLPCARKGTTYLKAHHSSHQLKGSGYCSPRWRKLRLGLGQPASKKDTWEAASPGEASFQPHSSHIFRGTGQILIWGL